MLALILIMGTYPRFVFSSLMCLLEEESHNDECNRNKDQNQDDT